MTEHNFFDEQKEQSQVKSTIVAKYFVAWAKVIINTQKRYPGHPQKIAYIDLFAGPGRYMDGAESTPIKILTTAIDDPDLRERLVTIFNDKNENFSNDLQSSIKKIPGIDALTYFPRVYNFEVGSEIVKKFESMKFIPTLFFVDPWGYKGLSIQLVNSVLKNWGCDAILFFNYNRINMGVSNASVEAHINALFGEERITALRRKIVNKKPNIRELLVVEELCQALKEFDSKFVLPFRFKNGKGQRTSHHLIFVSKHFRGYEIMKEIMAQESTDHTQGVPSFEYNPADLMPKTSLLFQLSRPLDDLRENLLEKFKGNKLTVKKIYERHNIDTRYVKKNYKKVLRELYDDGSIQAVSSKGTSPPKGTMGDSVLVTFPK